MNACTWFKTYRAYLLPALLFLSVTGLFLSAWSSYIQQNSSLFLPLVFLSLTYIFIIILGYYLPLSGNAESESGTREKDEPSSAKPVRSKENQSIMGEDELVIRLSGKTRKGGPGDKAHSILQNFAREFDLMQGVFYAYSPENNNYFMLATYALSGKHEPEPFGPGTGIHGQAAMEKKMVELANLPEEYTMAMSGLGNGYGKYLYLVPFVHEDTSIALVEFTVFKPVRDDYKTTLMNSLEKLGEKWVQLLKDAGQ